MGELGSFGLIILMGTRCLGCEVSLHGSCNSNHALFMSGLSKFYSLWLFWYLMNYLSMVGILFGWCIWLTNWVWLLMLI